MPDGYWWKWWRFMLGNEVQFHIWSLFPSFSFESMKEHKLSLIPLLPYKIPIILSPFNKVLEKWSQVKSALFPKPQRPQHPASLWARLFLFYLCLFMTARPDCQWNPQRVACQGLKFLWGSFSHLNTSFKGEEEMPAGNVSQWFCFVGEVHFVSAEDILLSHNAWPPLPCLTSPVCDSRANFFLTPNVLGGGSSTGVTTMVFLPHFSHSTPAKWRGNGKGKLRLLLPASCFFHPRGQVTTVPLCQHWVGKPGFSISKPSYLKSYNHHSN